MEIKLGQKVFHKDIYGGKEEMKIVGIREEEVELYGDYSGGVAAIRQKSWLPISGLIDKSLKASISSVVNYPTIGQRYTHYKGGVYQVVSLAKHSETNEDLVIYKSIGFGSVHARPLRMWFDIITIGEGKDLYTRPRFV